MGELEDRVKRLEKIIKDQRAHAINDVYRALDDEWRSSRQIHSLLDQPCLFQSARRYLLDLRDLGLAEHRQDSCGTAQWRKRHHNGEEQ